MENLELYKCSKCGCSGLHACTGHPLPEWTPEAIERFKEALNQIKEIKNEQR